jgi:hypothetical protein
VVFTFSNIYSFTAKHQPNISRSTKKRERNCSHRPGRYRTTHGAVATSDAVNFSGIFADRFQPDKLFDERGARAYP